MTLYSHPAKAPEQDEVIVRTTQGAHWPPENRIMTLTAFPATSYVKGDFYPADCRGKNFFTHFSNQTRLLPHEPGRTLF